MSLVPKWRRYLRFWRPDVEADIDDELRFHFDARTTELRARGLSPAEAQRVAAEEFGDVEATRRRLAEIGHRLERGLVRAHWWQLTGQDVHYALRGLRLAPLFTAGVVLTLALGIGAAATMYGIMRQLLVQPPPHVAAPELLLRPFFHYQSSGDSAQTGDRGSYPYLELLRQESRTLAGVAAYWPEVELAVGSGSDARMVRGTLVSAGFWHILGTRPLLGRFIADDEAHPATGARVVVLGHAFWQRRFGGDPAAVGATLQVKGQPYLIVGVAPRGFRGVELADTDVWLPLFAYEDGQGRPASWHTIAGSSILKFIARPEQRAATAAVAADLSRALRLMLEREDQDRPPERRGQLQSSVTLADFTGALGSDGRRIPEGTVAVWVTGVAGILLIVACANVASLLLLRALRRRREIAVRLALGMSRRRLTAMLLTESAMLALLGGAAAAVVVRLGGAWVRGMLLPGMIGEDAGTDWHTVAVAAGMVVAVALATGLVPVLQTRMDPAHGLRDGGGRGATRRSTLYRGLLVAQTALSTVLLVGAGLFLHSLHRVTTADLGLDTEHGIVVQVDFAGTGRTGRQRIAFFERALERVRALPGVEHASLATGAPLRVAYGTGVRLHPAGDEIHTQQGQRSSGNYVSDGFFEATGMRMVSGRTFQPADRTGDPVAIVNETLAAAGWGSRSPIGECIYRSSARDQCARIVGVVRDSRTSQIREERARPWVYSALDPADVDTRVLLLRTAIGAGTMAGTIDRTLRELDPTLPYVDVQRLGDVLDPQIRPWRLGAAVFTAFGALAALLAALGLYTAVAYAVTQRTHEMGIRIAVGASRPSVVRLVLGDGIRTSSVGIATGLLLALVAGRWAADLLFETSPREPAILLAVAGGLLVIATLASLVPARRAARVNPMDALRVD